MVISIDNYFHFFFFVISGSSCVVLVLTYAKENFLILQTSIHWTVFILLLLVLHHIIESFVLLLFEKSNKPTFSNSTRCYWLKIEWFIDSTLVKIYLFLRREIYTQKNVLLFFSSELELLKFVRSSWSMLQTSVNYHHLSNVKKQCKMQSSHF